MLGACRKKNLKKFKFFDFCQKNRQFSIELWKILANFAAVEIFSYLVYSPLKCRRFTGQNKIFAHSLIFWDITILKWSISTMLYMLQKRHILLYTRTVTHVFTIHCIDVRAYMCMGYRVTINPPPLWLFYDPHVPFSFLCSKNLTVLILEQND